MNCKESQCIMHHNYIFIDHIFKQVIYVLSIKETLMHSKMEHTMKWGYDNRTLEYGTHWSIDFLPVKIPYSNKEIIQLVRKLFLFYFFIGILPLFTDILSKCYYKIEIFTSLAK